MKILVYKRTHTGDPDAEGRFGIHDCMGTIRNLPFDAVVGVGGLGKEAQSHGIDRKVNWVGVNPVRNRRSNGARAGTVTFERFALFEDRGPLLHLLAPNLAKRMYAGRRFVFTSMTAAEHAEAVQLLELADQASSASPLDADPKSPPRCRPAKCVRKRRARRCG